MPHGPGELPAGVEALPGEDASAETHPGTASPSLVELLETAFDEERWDAFSRGSTIRRAGRAGFARNVCVALGNWNDPSAVAVLSEALADPEALVRGHAAWALGQIDSPDSSEALRSALSWESEPAVREKITHALAGRPSNVT